MKISNVVFVIAFLCMTPFLSAQTLGIADIPWNHVNGIAQDPSVTEVTKAWNQDGASTVEVLGLSMDDQSGIVATLTGGIAYGGRNLGGVVTITSQESHFVVMLNDTEGIREFHLLHTDFVGANFETGTYIPAQLESFTPHKGLESLASLFPLEAGYAFSFAAAKDIPFFQIPLERLGDISVSYGESGLSVITIDSLDHATDLIHGTINDPVPTVLTLQYKRVGNELMILGTSDNDPVYWFTLPSSPFQVLALQWETEAYSFKGRTYNEYGEEIVAKLNFSSTQPSSALTKQGMMEMNRVHIENNHFQLPKTWLDVEFLREESTDDGTDRHVYSYTAEGDTNSIMVVVLEPNGTFEATVSLWSNKTYSTEGDYQIVDGFLQTRNVTGVCEGCLLAAYMDANPYFALLRK